MAVTKKRDVRAEVMRFLKQEKRRISWLSEETGIPYSTLYFIFKKKQRTLTDEMRESINGKLNTNF